LIGASQKLRKQNTSQDKKARGLGRSAEKIKAKTPLPPLGSEVTESRASSPQAECNGIPEARKSERRIEYSTKQDDNKNEIELCISDNN
tara:strand:+ start:588 stop:854 length:267 start_codon:yes stop_codon:yes gene_type:complete